MTDAQASGAGEAAASACAIAAQRRPALHRHGRDAGRRGAGGAGRQGHPHGGGTAGHARATRRARRPCKRALERETLGYTVALGLPALRDAHRPTLSRALRCRRRARAGGGDDGILGRLRAGLSGAVRRRRQGGTAVARLSLLSPHPDRPRPVARHPRDRCRLALDADGAPRSRKRRGARASPGSSSPAPPIRRAPCWSRADWPRSRRSAGATGIWLVSDEIYHGLTYGLPEETALARPPDQAIVINSFSKYFSMTGWRVGWLVVPEELVRPDRAAGAEPLHLAARRGPGRGASAPSTASRSWRPTSASMPRTARCCWSELPKAGLDRIVPADGAFYLYVDVGDVHVRQRRLHQRDAGDIGVAATPGRRLRCRARRPLRALLLRRHDGRHGGGRAPAAGPGAASGGARKSWRSERRYLQARANALHS